jgi:hypothetical protein
MALGRLIPWLAIAMAAGGCQRGPAGHPDEAAAVRIIRELGGSIAFEDGLERRVNKVYLNDTAVADADLAVVENLPKLRNLFLGRTKIGDAGLEHLARASQLETLGLNETRVTDAGLKSLASLKRLKTVNLQATSVTANGAAELRRAIPGLIVAR